MTAKVRPNIPRAKRAGLDLDLNAVCAGGPRALEPDDHYRLKTYGICAQRHDDLFMVRLRVPAGRLDRTQVAVLADVARDFASGWVHLTTRQNVELHSVVLEDVPALYQRLATVGLVGRSSCGHTIRNVLACPNADTSADEPFDVTVDARWLSQQLVARSRELNRALPSRLNISLGGCTQCGLEALTNDIGLVACTRDGEPGYQVWAGGSLGTAPRLAMLLRPFISRDELGPAVWAIVEWFCAEGDLETVAKGRLKFVIDARGETTFRQAFSRRFAELRAGAPAMPPVRITTPDAFERVLAYAPAAGWRDGIRPERHAGLASVTVRIPLGDLLVDELEQIAELAPDGTVVLTRDQNLIVRSVPVEEVDAVLDSLDELRLGPAGVGGEVDVRACPGLAFCSLAITPSQAVARAIEQALTRRGDLPRDLTVAVSGCPNSCTKHQAADIGLAGIKIKEGAYVSHGYQLFLGADLAGGQVGEPVLRLLATQVPDAVVAVTEVWAASRRARESPGATFRRLGLAAVAAAIEARMRPERVRPEPANELSGAA